MQEKKKSQWWSLVGVIVLAILLPVILRATNQVLRLLVGAEGRLAAIAVETDHVLGPQPAPWKSLAQGADNLPKFLDGIAREVIRVKPESIRIDHIYDEFGVVSKKDNGLTYDWSRLDEVVNRMLQIGAKPFLVLSYMPLAISSGDMLATPRDWNEWSSVVQKTIEHYSGDLGIENVYYEVWNEPDLFGKWKIGGGKDYRTLYLYAARGAQAAKNVKQFKFGGPAIAGLYKNWMDGFFPYILENRLRMDFFSWHRYDKDVTKYLADVENVDAWLDRHPYFAQVEKIVSEFGPSSEAGGDNDTNMGAAHLVAVMRELMYKVARGFSFSVDGSFGMLGKPRFEALEMLAAMGNERLAVTGEGTWVKAIGSKNSQTYQVILTNYDDKNAHSEVVPVTFLNLKERAFTMRKTVLGGEMTSKEIATTEALLQEEVPMSPNSVVLLELEPVINPL